MTDNHRVLDPSTGPAVAARILWGDDAYDSTRQGGIGETDIDDVRPWLAELPTERVDAIAAATGPHWGEVIDATTDEIKAVANLGLDGLQGVAAHSDLEIDGEALAAFLHANRTRTA
ncbi:hypothetical protein DVS28_b0207 (plasmid) [Euzebya pacifica]|uniref:Uncharacterized protein n=1 Tax=Euzebya pacifica TaxID=1608957 RepID=A0A346Y680_9ACTN|nr:hypothetical protein [Euzebya pacifica]AXV09977.1 hypothetical protein DVS28_b0207 [Euzebya pacifica]